MTQHNIAIGSLVEIKLGEGYGEEGLRLYVVDHYEDFDGSPLYRLSMNRDLYKDIFDIKTLYLAYGRIKMADMTDMIETLARKFGTSDGWSEECLTIIRAPVVE